MDQEKGNRFHDAIAMARRGALLDELDAGIEKVLEAVRRTGKGGAVRLNLKFALASKGDDGVLTMADAVSLTVPEAEKGISVVFATDENRIQRDDPRQLAIADLNKPEPKPEPQPLETPARPALVRS
jgi:hypothetical protein